MMTRGQKLILVSLILGWILPASSHAAGTVVISEVAAFEPEGREWVEIVNVGTDPVDLTGWKFVEDGANHGLKLITGDSAVLAPGQYAIIADDAAQFQNAYPETLVTIFDSSWGTLKETGEPIGLRDVDGVMAEQFTYPAVSGGSAERIDIASSGEDANNWQLSPTEHSSGQANSPLVADVTVSPGDDEPLSTGSDEETEGPPEQPAPEEIVEEVVAETVPAALPCDQGLLELSELVSDPVDGEEEFVELHHRGSRSAALTGWSIADGAGRTTALDDYFVLPASFLVITKPKGVLNNSGDQVVLSCGGQTVDLVTYGTWDDGSRADNVPTAIDPWSLMRFEQGQWLVTTTPTKGQANSYTAPPTPEVKVRAPAAAEEVVVTPEPTVEDIGVEIVGANTGCIQLSEVLPNPIGDDAAGEFIELYNCDSQPLNLVGWSVVVGSKKFVLSGEGMPLDPGTWLALFRADTKLTLRNSGGETVTLFQPDGMVVDSVEYAAALLEQSYVYIEPVWQWSAQPTPGAANVNVVANEPPTAEFQLTHPRRTEVGESITADASDSSDVEDDTTTLQYAWDWGDGEKQSGQIAEHYYATPGKYKVTLVVTDTAGAIDRVARQLTVYPPNEEKESAPTSSAAKTSPETIITPAQLAQQPLNRRVQLTGTVVALPGVFGRQTMFVDGAEIYFGAADWPELTVGDVVRVTGTVGQRSGQKRLRLADRQSMVLLRHDEIAPQIITTPPSAERQRLVKVTGTVTEVRKTELLLAGDFGVMAVVIKKSTGIGALALVVGQSVTITGLLMDENGLIQVWPRVDADIAVATDTAAIAPVMSVAASVPAWWQPAMTGFGAVGALWWVVQGTLG